MFSAIRIKFRKLIRQMLPAAQPEFRVKPYVRIGDSVYCLKQPTGLLSSQTVSHANDGDSTMIQAFQRTVELSFQMQS